MLVLDQKRSPTILFTDFFPEVRIVYDLRFQDNNLKRNNVKTVEIKYTPDGVLDSINLGSMNSVSPIERDYYILRTLVELLVNKDESTLNSLDIKNNSLKGISDEVYEVIYNYYGISHIYSSAYIEVSKLLPREKRSKPIVNKILADAFKLPELIIEELK